MGIPGCVGLRAVRWDRLKNPEGGVSIAAGSSKCGGRVQGICLGTAQVSVCTSGVDRRTVYLKNPESRIDTQFDSGSGQ